ncbi:MAG: type II toxin-antitoxin system VapC family toxin [Pseudomonadota bacterium]
MILADTSIWVDHLWASDPLMADRLNSKEILCHPLVIGELAMGNLANRATLLHALTRIPQAVRARDSEVMALVERERLFGIGIGFVDAHLLASTLLTDGARLWTRDRRLHAAAVQLEIALDLALPARH